ncbi:hypothetical protein GQ42DRAFT_7279 [Ramicandelaber brevisporus]|nr:hypothetical protein GQ42DRAFT_7279 [Ramicandelaber brevisporus]
MDATTPPPPVAVRVPTELLSASRESLSPYETLGVDKTASQEQVLDAAIGKFFSSLGIETRSTDVIETSAVHPPATELNSAEVGTNKLVLYKAFSVLYDNEQRAVYDSYGWTPFGKLGVFNDDGLLNHRLILPFQSVNREWVAKCSIPFLCFAPLGALIGYFVGNASRGFANGAGLALIVSLGIYVHWAVTYFADMAGTVWELTTHTAIETGGNKIPQQHQQQQQQQQQQQLVRKLGRLLILGFIPHAAFVLIAGANIVVFSTPYFPGFKPYPALYVMITNILVALFCFGFIFDCILALGRLLRNKGLKMSNLDVLYMAIHAHISTIDDSEKRHQLAQLLQKEVESMHADSLLEYSARPIAVMPVVLYHVIPIIYAINLPKWTGFVFNIVTTVGYVYPYLVKGLTWLFDKATNSFHFKLPSI